MVDKREGEAMKKPFQIGERVAVYYNESPNRYVGTITGVSDTYIDFKTDYGALFGAHIKQCRRLKPKKKAREWQILFVTNATNRTSFHKVYPGGWKVNYKGTALETYELIRVREVL